MLSKMTKLTRLSNVVFLSLIGALLNYFSCIAVGGLSSHPFGSWKQRGGQFMWLRDTLASSSNGVRVLLYGYDTPLVQSESFQDIDDIGNKFCDFIKRLRLPHTVWQRPECVGGMVNGILRQRSVKSISSGDPLYSLPIA